MDSEILMNGKGNSSDKLFDKTLWYKIKQRFTQKYRKYPFSSSLSKICDINVESVRES